MFQNKLPVLLYFHVLLTLKSEKPNKFEVVYKRHNLTFIVDLMDNSDYFRVMSYSM